MIQMILIVRLITTWLQVLWPHVFVTVPRYQILLMALSFTFAELVPFMVVVYGIYLQIEWRDSTNP
jgi:hypothetical protein